MRQIYALITIMMFAFTLNAQYIYNDFDDNQNETFSGWPNTPATVTNPDASGINTSANVAEWVRSEEQWAHVYCDLEGTIDFTTGNVFELKVYLPIACTILFKLESSAGDFTELSADVTTVNEWTQLNYDFTGAQSDLYNKIVIFFDFSTFTDNTYYFDDVTGPEYSGGGSGTPVALPVTFDDDEVDYGLTDFGGNVSEIIVDPTNAANKVAQTIKTEAAETWAGTTVGGAVGFADPIPFEEASTFMSVAVWSPTVGTPIRLKVEDSTDPTISVETEALTTVASTWETLVFDFSNEATGTAPINFANSYNKASMFFNFGTTGAQAGEQTYYWDDMEFGGGGSGVKPLLAINVQDNFEDDGWGTITTWMFQDPDLVDLTIVADPINATNNVVEYNRSGGFEWTNAQFVLEHRMDLSQRNKFVMDIYFPSTNNYTGSLTPTAALKLQNSLLGGNAWSTQTEIKLDVTQFDEWVTLTFDFSAIADSVNYDQIVVQFGGEGHFEQGMFYFDNIELLEYTNIFERNLQELSLLPNPVQDILVLNNIDNVQFIYVYSLSGQIFEVDKISENRYDVSGLSKGVYTVLVIDEKGNNLVGKVLKQ